MYWSCVNLGCKCGYWVLVIWFGGILGLLEVVDLDVYLFQDFIELWVFWVLFLDEEVVEEFQSCWIWMLLGIKGLKVNFFFGLSFLVLKVKLCFWNCLVEEGELVESKLSQKEFVVQCLKFCKVLGLGKFFMLFFKLEKFLGLEGLLFNWF